MPKKYDKIIFLDIDGVLNSENWYKKRYVMPEFKEYLDNKKHMSDIQHDAWEFDPDAVARLNKIIKETGAKIVVSSVWRNMPNIKDILKDVGIIGEVVGITPTIWDLKHGKSNIEIKSHVPRGIEIQEWIYANYKEYSDREDLKYVMIDDDCDIYPSCYFVNTSWRTGLTDELAQKAIDILNVCSHDNIRTEIETNVFPYGDSINVDYCSDCGKRVNTRSIN